ncbi:hypothetical protein HMPREF1544_11935 [Mucor circinelloides 1006PhL]|uniref:F-box domain-containing protein n=1 Tax=Mucor circinelloides f. circinelloides (strain 1006PhL) TaxID=1220926 RepID=S2IUP0_MUCC1|nr:hypothetical protein HMPREF1544_11935 [Mucor circinelloides 1006PhL]KAG1123716.1 hypothetical protein G6F42_010287 [Rhizopus arrhizus]
MKASIQQLPTEVIINIFDQINDAKQLIQCILVCKSWAFLAEKSMYKSVHLYLWDNSRLERLNYRLKQKPECCQLIEKIHITEQYYNTFSKALFREFLQLAMTPRIQTLDGVWNQKYIVSLLDHIENSPFSFEKLKQLPYSVRHDSIYMQLMSHFKGSLQTGFCTITEKTSQIHQRIISDSFMEFKHLKTLSIQDSRGFKNVQEMDTFLKKCDRITNLEFIISQSSEYIGMDKDELNQWLINSNVQQAGNVKNLRIAYMRGPDSKCRTFGPDWINYLAFKCPNVDTLSIKNITLKYSHMALSVFENVKTFSLTDWKFYCTQDIQHFIDRVKSDNNSIVIRYTKTTAVDQSEICVMSAKKERNSNMTRFAIEISAEIYKNTAIVLLCFKNLSYICDI